MFAVVVTGPPGSGKSTLLTALHDVLADDDVAHAVIELEAVAFSHPQLPEERALEHLAAASRMYAEAGFALVLVGTTATSSDQLAGVIRASGADEHLVVRLEARADTLRHRLTAREPPEWSGLTRLLESLPELAAVSVSLEGVDLTCSTETASPLEVAARVRKARPDLLLPTAPVLRGPS